MFIGADVHRRETQLYFLPKNGSGGRELRVPTKEKAIQKALEKVDGPIVLEAVGFYRPIAAWLTKDGREVRLANPRLIPKPKVKTDKKDAKHLAKLLKADILPESWIAPEEIEKLRDLVRHRRFLGEESGRLKTKIKADLLKHGHFYEKNPADTKKGREIVARLPIPETQSTLRLLEHIEMEMLLFDRSIKLEAAKRDEVQLLMSIPGVGAQTALGIFAEVGDFARFATPEKLASYAGLAIQQEQSGDRDKRGHITKEGNKLLLTLLVEAAHNHIMHCEDSQIIRKFNRKKERDDNTKRAYIAAARALLHTMHAMIRTKTEFQVNPEPRRDTAV